MAPALINKDGNYPHLRDEGAGGGGGGGSVLEHLLWFPGLGSGFFRFRRHFPGKNQTFQPFSQQLFVSPPVIKSHKIGFYCSFNDDYVPTQQFLEQKYQFAQ